MSLAAAAAELGVSIGHNSFFTASNDFLADGSVCLLPLDEGAPAQLPVPPVSKVGPSGCCERMWYECGAGIGHC